MIAKMYIVLYCKIWLYCVSISYDLQSLETLFLQQLISDEYLNMLHDEEFIVQFSFKMIN